MIVNTFHRFYRTISNKVAQTERYNPSWIRRHTWKRREDA